VQLRPGWRAGRGWHGGNLRAPAIQHPHTDFGSFWREEGSASAPPKCRVPHDGRTALAAAFVGLGKTKGSPALRGLVLRPKHCLDDALD
jgi:hypothetical protein